MPQFGLPFLVADSKLVEHFYSSGTITIILNLHVKQSGNFSLIASLIYEDSQRIRREV